MKPIPLFQRLFLFIFPAVAAAEKPNAMVIFADDQRYGDRGFFNAKHVQAPRLDQVAAQGSRLTNFQVAAPVCTASRAALMTGSYPKRVNLATGSKFGILFAGDLRLLVTQVDGKPRAVLCEPVSPGTTGEKVPFNSPWRTITFDRVEDVSDRFELATDSQGFYEVSIPLKTLGLKATDVQRMKADIGSLPTNGTETTAPSYWSNKAIGIPADVPSEAALTPHLG